MWFCQKCNKWYCDSVTILKHFETRHTAPSSTVNPESNEVSSSQNDKGKGGLHILKPTLAKLLKIRKRKNSHLSNGALEGSTKSKISSQKRKDLEAAEAAKKQTPLASDPPLPKNVGLMHITNKKDSSSIDQVMIVGNMNEDGVLNKIKTYICKFCCRRFHNSDLLQAHLKTHQAKPVHACHVCGITAGTFSALMAHYVKHSGLKTLNVSNTPNETKIFFREPENKGQSADRNIICCNQCKRIFTSKKVYNIHYCPPVGKKSEYVCTYCRQITTSVEEYRDHIQSHSPSAPFMCKYCPSKFGSKSKLLLHMKTCPRKDAVPVQPLKKGSKVYATKPTKFQRMHSKGGQVMESNSCNNRKNKNLCASEKNEVKVAIKPTSVSLQVDNHVPGPSVIVAKKKPLPVSRSPPKVESTDPPQSKPSDMEEGESDEDIHHRLRPKKAKVAYTSDSSPEVAGSTQPMRRSARLVNRKHLRFSRHSSDSESETDKKTDAEIPSSPVAEAPASPLGPSIRHRNSGSPKKDETFKLRVSPSRSPKAKLGNQKNLVTVSPKKVTARLKPVTTSCSPKKMCATKRKRQAKEEEEEEEDETGADESYYDTLYCNQCSLIFRSVGSLKRHKKMHTGKPQFVCQFCGKFFYRRDIHRRHETNVHHGCAPPTFTCYYCKHIFDSSNDLKDHAFKIHSGRASAPERIRRCTPKSPTKKIMRRVSVDTTVVDTNMTVKQEIKETVVKEPPPMPKTSAMIYKCGKCDIAFDVAQSLVKHCEEKHSVKDDLNITKAANLPKDLPNKSEVPVARVRAQKHALSSLKPTIQNIEEEPVLPAKKKLPNLILKSPTVINMNEKESSSRDVPQTNEDYSCSVCFTSLPERGTMMCTKPEVHKAVDWYQCQLCSLAGPKDKVHEHMLQHMLKRGTFIVNVNDTEYKVINDYMNNLDNKTPVQVQADLEEAPSIYTLMEEVICSRCSEIIVDFTLLIHHPCSEVQDGIYSCFVKDCDFSTETLSDFENHLKFSHYQAVYPNRSQFNASTSAVPVITTSQNVTDIRILNNNLIE